MTLSTDAVFSRFCSARVKVDIMSSCLCHHCQRTSECSTGASMLLAVVPNVPYFRVLTSGYSLKQTRMQVISANSSRFVMILSSTYHAFIHDYFEILMVGADELYDISVDINETQNLVTRFPDLSNALARLHKTWEANLPPIYSTAATQATRSRECTRRQERISMTPKL
jgi:hypothetical protein